jgi:magnesium-transporting ATPase (P-type)
VESDQVVDENDVATTPNAVPPYALDASDVAASLGTDATSGLTAGETAIRLGQYGPNQIMSEKPPSVWALGAGQFRNLAPARGLAEATTT